MPLDHSVLLVRLAVAAALGGAIGFERDRHKRAAGLRTHMLVSLAAACFVIVSTQFAYYQGFQAGGIIEVDASRIASEVVSGAGFLVGGAILRSGLTVRGLTTAAALWLVTSLGVAAGAGMFAEAAAGCALGLLALWALRPLERKGTRRVHGRVSLQIAGQPSMSELTRLIEATGASVMRHDYRVSYGEPPLVQVAFVIRHDASFSTDRVVEMLQTQPGIRMLDVQRSG